MRNYFFGDDFLGLYQVAEYGVLRFLIIPNAGHVLLARNAIFGLTYEAFGPRPEAFYWSIFVGHLVNVWLLFRLIIRVTASRATACIGAALWGTSLLHEGTLGQYCNLGNVLVGAASLLVLGDIVAAASEERPPSRCKHRVWYGLALVAAFSWGAGIAVAVLLPFVTLLLGNFGRSSSRWRFPLGSLVVVVVLGYLGIIWLYETTSGLQALMQPSLMKQFVNPLGTTLFGLELVAFGTTYLLLGGYSPQVRSPAIWLALLGVVVVASIVTIYRSPTAVVRRILAFSLLALGCYGIIALGRGAYFADLPAELVFLGLGHYHYVGQLFLTVVICVVLSQTIAIRPTWTKVLVCCGWYGLAIGLHLGFGTAIDNHDQAREDTAAVLGSIRAAVDKQPRGATVYIVNRPFKAYPFLFPGWKGVLTIFHPDQTVDGRRVVFTAPSG